MKVLLLHFCQIIHLSKAQIPWLFHSPLRSSLQMLALPWILSVVRTETLFVNSYPHAQLFLKVLFSQNLKPSSSSVYCFPKALFIKGRSSPKLFRGTRKEACYSPKFPKNFQPIHYPPSLKTPPALKVKPPNSVPSTLLLHCGPPAGLSLPWKLGGTGTEFPFGANSLSISVSLATE